MRKLPIEEGKKFGLSPKEVDAYNEWEYRKAEGGRTPYPSRLSAEELQANLQAIKDFSATNPDLENKFYKIKSEIESHENYKFSNFILILAIISVLLFFGGYIPFLIPVILVGGYFYTR